MIDEGLITGGPSPLDEGVNFLFGRNRLKKAIERGLASGKLSEELDELGELKLKSRGDAEAVCWGLQQLLKDTKGLDEKTHALVGLFQDVEDGGCDAAEVLRERGIPELLRLYEELPADSAEGGINTRLLILKIVALYGTTDGAFKIIEAAREPLKPDDYMWCVILGMFKSGHPQNDLIYRSLREPLPPGFIAVSLLDAANACMLQGEQMTHPFDSAEGERRLEAWLKNADEGEYSYGYSATVALPFISSSAQDRLLELAMAHPEVKVRIEAAWAAAKTGHDHGFRRLRSIVVRRC